MAGAASSHTAQNRRLAELRRREADGYFSLAAVRAREPALHALYLPAHDKQAADDAAAKLAFRSELLRAEGIVQACQRVSSAESPPPPPPPSGGGRVASLFGQMQAEADGTDSDGGDDAAAAAAAAAAASRGAETMEEDPPSAVVDAAAPDTRELQGVASQVKRMLEAELSRAEEGAAGASAAAPSVQERAALENELVGLVMARFLSGRDSGVDYAAVDGDEGLDDLVQMGVDAEARYFEEDGGGGGGAEEEGGKEEGVAGSAAARTSYQDGVRRLMRAAAGGGVEGGGGSIRDGSNGWGF